jgi:hypothetical protein
VKSKRGRTADDFRENNMLYAVAAVAAFNLVCSGTTTKTDYNGSKSEAYTATYRVDTAARLWCLDDDNACKSPEPLVDISPVSIKFVDATTDKPDQYFRYVDQVNRETGAHQSLIISGRDAQIRIVKKEGHCEPTAFSGFPKAVQKF